MCESGQERQEHEKAHNAVHQQQHLVLGFADDNVGRRLDTRVACREHEADLIGVVLGGERLDVRHDAFLSKTLAKASAAKKRAWAVQTMKNCARAAKNLGVKVVNGFTGSAIWPLLYSFPPVPESTVEAGFAQFAERWNPILDVFAECGVRFALEVHPTEIAFDIYTAKRALEALGNREEIRGYDLSPAIRFEFLEDGALDPEWADLFEFGWGDIVDYGIKIQATLEAGRFTKGSFDCCAVRVEALVPESSRNSPLGLCPVQWYCAHNPRMMSRCSVISSINIRLSQWKIKATGMPWAPFSTPAVPPANPRVRCTPIILSTWGC
mgnify:CR=1 FL=1